MKKIPSNRIKQDVEEKLQRAVTEVKDSIKEEFAKIKNAMR